MKKKVLIIDDEQDLCYLMRSYLVSKDCDVKISNTLNGGLDILAGYHPDVLFLDNNLPDGFGWARAVDISRDHPFLKINLMSGERPAVLQAIVTGRFSIMEKPLSFKSIDSAVG